MNIPCKECISFAICKQQMMVECPPLYKYFCDYDMERDEFNRHTFIGYNKNIDNVEETFEKYVKGTRFDSSRVYFTNQKDKAVINRQNRSMENIKNVRLSKNKNR